MLKIYYADALTDREKFIFDHVDPRRRTILLVPDQSSLQAEQDALRYSGKRALLDLMVTDFSALGHKVVKETEGHEPEIIDKYGRHMLLSVLLERMGDELQVLRNRRRGGGLADQMNTMISEMKRYEIGPEQLAETIRQLKQESGERAPGYLILKLEDLLRVFQAYEDAIGGIYRDAEDYITYYADRIPGSSLVRGADVWIYGFDTFTPKNLMVIRRILETADSVSVVLLYEDAPAERRSTAGDHPVMPEDTLPVRALTQGGGAGLFRLTEQVMQRLEQAAEESGQESVRQQITGYRRRSIWTGAGSTEEGSAEGWSAKEEGTKESGPEGADVRNADAPDVLRDRIRLVRASGSFEEAESAAAYIQSLVRDEGFRYGQIAVLCNDMDGRGRTLRRTLERWDIPVFADQKRKVLHQPVVSFLLSFLEVLSSGLSGSGVIGMIKSGMLGFTPEDEALLENYITAFRIRGSRWMKPFSWDGGTYSEEELQRLNEMRAFLVSVCTRAKDAVGRRNTAEEKIRGLAGFLQEEFQILERIEQAVERQQELHLMEGAAETAQIWNAICGILDQIVRVIGAEKISNSLLQDTVAAGLETLEIGLVPASGDCVLMGTLQRSRPGRIRALVVTGANAGLLPLDAAEDGLLSRRERQRLEELDLEFAGRERVAQMEEQLAIYRMFSLPSERLYVSCSMSGDDGSMLRPSEVFRQLQQWQPAVEGDLSSRPAEARIGSRRATVPYLAEALRGGAGQRGAGESDVRERESWQEVLRWYDEKDPRQAEKLRRGLYFSNRVEALGERLADALYRGDREALEVSASRLEKFSGCPFSHFIQYGLRAQEQRLFEVGGREIGDVYHQCMMEFSRILEAESAWQTITEEDCRKQVARILQGEAGGYREGLFASDEDSRFRLERITEICGDIAWALVRQVRHGSIRRMYFEEPFRRGSRIPAVDVRVGEQTVRIRGIIDRMDVLDAEDGREAIRIVDYKTGSNTIRAEDFRSGYRLQLMVYMDAALRAGNEEPAGVFYFKIKDFTVDGDQSAGIPDPEDPADLERRMQKFYRMEGLVVNDASLIGAMDDRVDGTDKAESNVIPVKYDPKKESYAQTGGGTLLQKEEFRELLEETNRQVERICDSLCRGEIRVLPKRETNKDRDGNRITACRYCGFQSICSFDPSIPGCRYENVPATARP